MAQFSVGGQMIGAAARTVSVNEQAIPDGQADNAPGVDMIVPPQVEAPDLTITITKGNTLRADRLVWSLETPHADLPVTPDDTADAVSDLGSEPARWARNLMNQVHLQAASQPNLRLLLRGTGTVVAAKIPTWVRRCLYLLSKMDGDKKTILIVSNEPNVPWELAYLDVEGDHGPHEDFFGAAFAIGRWVIGRPNAVTGVVKPAYPPPMRIGVRRMAVVSGDYSGTRGWGDLAGAHEEAAALVERYGAQPVKADTHLATWLDSANGFDAIHFAVHGKSDLVGANGGIALVDGTMLTPEMIMGLRLQGAPFIFLNACQLGQGEETLGEYGGVAAAFP